MPERKSSNAMPPVIYMHQVWHGEELPILVQRTPDALVASLYHLPDSKGSICVHYARRGDDGETKSWVYRFYETPEEAEAFFEDVLLSDWNDEQGNEIRPEQWYTAQIHNTEVVSVQHALLEKVGDDVLDPFQQVMDAADKYALEEIIDRLKQEGIDIK